MPMEKLRFGLLGGGFNSLEKNMLVKLDHVPKVRGENKTSLKPPPSKERFGLG